MRKFGIVMCSIISIMMIILLTISFSMKKMIVSTLSEVALKEKSVDEISNLLYDNFENVNEEEIKIIQNALSNNDNLEIITDKFLTSAINDLSKKENDFKSPDVKEETQSLINEGLNILEKEKGITISKEKKDEIISKSLNDENISKVYNNVITTLKNNEDKTVNEIIYAYNFFTNDTVRIVFSSVLIFCFILMFILAKPKITIMLSTGITLLITGIIIAFVFVSLIDFVGDIIAEQFITGINAVETETLSKIGYVSMIGGLVLLIFYKLLSKKKELN